MTGQRILSPEIERVAAGRGAWLGLPWLSSVWLPQAC